MVRLTPAAGAAPAAAEPQTTIGEDEVLVEAGPRLAGAFAQLGLVDEFVIFIAGKFLGSTARPLLDWPLAYMKDAPELKITEIRAVGDDWRVTAIPVLSASV